nr:hypothetical 10.2K protein - rice stripe virus [Tenuivirus oryzaclavatae]
MKSQLLFVHLSILEMLETRSWQDSAEQTNSKIINTYGMNISPFSTFLPFLFTLSETLVLGAMESSTTNRPSSASSTTLTVDISTDTSSTTGLL